MAKSLIGNYNNQERHQQTFKTTKHVNGNFPTEAPSHLPELEPSRGRCFHYKKTKKKQQQQQQGKGNETFLKCNTCGVFFCLVAFASGRNCFYKHHLQA